MEDRKSTVQYSQKIHINVVIFVCSTSFLSVAGVLQSRIRSYIDLQTENNEVLFIMVQALAAGAGSELKQEVRSDYFRYLIPTLVGQIAHSFYCMADVFFVGATVGSNGLAALNVALPIFTLYSAFSIMVGVGTATTVSVLAGQRDTENSNRVFTQSMVLLGAVGLLLTLLTSVFIRQVARLFGATDLIIDGVVAYMRPINALAFVYIFSGALGVIVRADGNPKLVMVAGTCGNLCNIFLDYLFIMVLGMGVFGAGLATILGHCVTVSLLALHFLLRAGQLRFVRHFFSPAFCRRVLQNGVGSSILELSAGFIVLLFNLVLLRVSGENAVAIFSVLSNIAYVGKGMFNGMAQAAQPIISTSYGAGRFDKVRLVNRYAMLTAAVFSTLIYGALLLFPAQIIGIFVEPSLIPAGSRALSLYFLSFPFTGLNTVMMYYFQSLERVKYTSLIAILRGVVFISGALLLFSTLWGETGVWLALFAAECTTYLIFWPVRSRFDHRMAAVHPRLALR